MRRDRVDSNVVLITPAADNEGIRSEKLKAARGGPVADDSAFLNNTNADLRRWTESSAKWKLTMDDFEWLVTVKKDLSEMEALMQLRLAKARIDRCRKVIADLIIKSALKFFT